MRPFDLSIDDPNTPQTTTSKTPRDDRKDPTQEDIYARSGRYRVQQRRRRPPETRPGGAAPGTWAPCRASVAPNCFGRRGPRPTTTRVTATTPRTAPSEPTPRREDRAVDDPAEGASAALRRREDLHLEEPTRSDASGAPSRRAAAGAELHRSRRDVGTPPRQGAAAGRADGSSPTDARETQDRESLASRDRDRRATVRREDPTSRRDSRARETDRTDAGSRQERQTARAAQENPGDAGSDRRARAGADARSPGIHRVGHVTATASTGQRGQPGTTSHAAPAGGRVSTPQAAPPLPRPRPPCPRTPRPRPPRPLAARTPAQTSAPRILPRTTTTRPRPNTPTILRTLEALPHPRTPFPLLLLHANHR